MQVDTDTHQVAAAMDSEAAPDSPAKAYRDAKATTLAAGRPSAIMNQAVVRSFDRRYHTQIAESEVFALRLSPDSSFVATSLFDGSLHIVSTGLGEA